MPSTREKFANAIAGLVRDKEVAVERAEADFRVERELRSAESRGKLRWPKEQEQLHQESRAQTSSSSAGGPLNFGPSRLLLRNSIGGPFLCPRCFAPKRSALFASSLTPDKNDQLDHLLRRDYEDGSCASTSSAAIEEEGGKGNIGTRSSSSWTTADEDSDERGDDVSPCCCEDHASAWGWESRSRSDPQPSSSSEWKCVICNVKRAVICCRGCYSVGYCCREHRRLHATLHREGKACLVGEPESSTSQHCHAETGPGPGGGSSTNIFPLLEYPTCDELSGTWRAKREYHQLLCSTQRQDVAAPVETGLWAKFHKMLQALTALDQATRSTPARHFLEEIPHVLSAKDSITATAPERFSFSTCWSTFLLNSNWICHLPLPRGQWGVLLHFLAEVMLLFQHRDLISKLPPPLEEPLRPRLKVLKSRKTDEETDDLQKPLNRRRADEQEHTSMDEYDIDTHLYDARLGRHERENLDVLLHRRHNVPTVDKYFAPKEEKLPNEDGIVRVNRAQKLEDDFFVTERASGTSSSKLPDYDEIINPSRGGDGHLHAGQRRGRGPLEVLPATEIAEDFVGACNRYDDSSEDEVGAGARLLPTLKKKELRVVYLHADPETSDVLHFVPEKWSLLRSAYRRIELCFCLPPRVNWNCAGWSEGLHVDRPEGSCDEDAPGLIARIPWTSATATEDREEEKKDRGGLTVRLLSQLHPFPSGFLNPRTHVFVVSEVDDLESFFAQTLPAQLSADALTKQIESTGKTVLSRAARERVEEQGRKWKEELGQKGSMMLITHHNKETARKNAAYAVQELGFSEQISPSLQKENQNEAEVADVDVVENEFASPLHLYPHFERAWRWSALLRKNRS